MRRKKEGQEAGRGERRKDLGQRQWRIQIFG